MTRDVSFFSESRLNAILRAGVAYEQSLDKRQRGRTGTFYTPWELANRVVKIALEPLFLRSDGSPRSAEELRELRICDPALGTGVFLLAACVQLTERIAKLEMETLLDGTGNVGGLAGKSKPRAVELGRHRQFDAPFPVAISEVPTDEKRRMAPQSFDLLSVVPTDSEWRVFPLSLGAFSENLAGTEGTKRGTLPQTSDALSAFPADAGRTPPPAPAGFSSHLQIQQIAWYVATNCLFGADIDAEAVLLARQALWKLVRGDAAMPSGFLAQHLLVADSLKSACFPAGTFDAVLGNPPFLGGRKIRRMLGDEYFQFLTRYFAPGARGNAALCAVFCLLALRLLRTDGGICGFLATSSIGEGDTRAVGLDVLVQQGGEIFHAEQFPWPSDAAVHAAMVFVRFASPEVPRLPCWLNGQPTKRIFSSLRALDTSAVRHVFPENTELCFQGSVLAAKGFILTPEEAAELIQREPQSREIVRPYFTGDEVFQAVDTLDLRARRYVIAFHDRSEEEARQYPLAFQLVRERVFPVRSRARRATHRQHWWQFGDKRPALWQKIRSQGLQRVLLQTRHAKFLVPTFVPAEAIYSESVVLFPSESFGLFVLLNSGVHETWARQTASTLGRELRYTPTDVFYTFPLLPDEKLRELEPIGHRLFALRQELCMRENCGLTRLYTRMHQPNVAELAELRELHRELDIQVLRLYWGDWQVPVESHAFRETPLGTRFVLNQAIQQEILNRILDMTRGGE